MEKIKELIESVMVARKPGEREVSFKLFCNSNQSIILSIEQSQYNSNCVILISKFNKLEYPQSVYNIKIAIQNDDQDNLISFFINKRIRYFNTLYKVNGSATYTKHCLVNEIEEVVLGLDRILP